MLASLLVLFLTTAPAPQASSNAALSVCEASKDTRYDSTRITVHARTDFHAHGVMLIDDRCPDAVIHIKHHLEGVDAGFCALGERFSCPGSIEGDFSGMFRIRKSGRGWIELDTLEHYTSHFEVLPKCEPMPRLVQPVTPDLSPDLPIGMRSGGAAVMEFDVRPDGSIGNPVIIQTEGLTEDPGTRARLLGAIAKWRFEPVSGLCIGRARLRLKPRDEAGVTGKGRR